jgi:hypothetical protein
MSSVPQNFVPSLRRAAEGWQLESGQRVLMTFLAKDGNGGVLMFLDLQEIDASRARDVFTNSTAAAA